MANILGEIVKSGRGHNLLYEGYALRKDRRYDEKQHWRCTVAGCLSFLDRLLAQGWPVFFIIQYFRSCAMSSVSWYFFSQKPLFSAISHKCGYVLTSSSCQTTFCFIGKFQQVLRALPS